jgi:hypothetical protein
MVFCTLRTGKLCVLFFVVLGVQHRQQRRAQLLLRFEKGEALANFVFIVFRFLHRQERRGQLLIRFEKEKTLATICSWFSVVYSQTQRMHLLIRFEKGETLAILSWFSVFYTTKSEECNFSSALRRGKLSRVFHGFPFST